MDAVSLHAPELPSAEVIDLAAYRRARAEQHQDPAPERPDPYPWAYTFGPDSP